MSISFEFPKLPDTISDKDRKALETLSSDFKKVFGGDKVDPEALKRMLENVKKVEVEDKIRPILSEYTKIIEAFANKVSGDIKHALSKHRDDDFTPLSESLPPAPLPPRQRPQRPAPIITKPLTKDPFSLPAEEQPKSDSPVSGPVSGSEPEMESPLTPSELKLFEKLANKYSDLAKTVQKDKLSPEENDKLREELKDLLKDFEEDEFADFRNVIRSCNTLLIWVISEPYQYRRLSEGLQKLSDEMKALLANDMKPVRHIYFDEKEEDALQLDSPPADSSSKKKYPPEAEDSLQLDSPPPKPEEESS
jgi:hypothetical protein